MILLLIVLSNMKVLKFSLKLWQMFKFSYFVIFLLSILSVTSANEEVDYFDNDLAKGV